MMHSPDRLKAMTVQRQRELQIKNKRDLEDRFHQLVAELPDITEQAAKEGKFESKIFEFAVTRTWLFDKLHLNYTDNYGWLAYKLEIWEIIVLPLIDYCRREGFKTNYRKTDFCKITLIVSWN